MQKITPFLWFDGKAEEATRFYTSVFKDSSIESLNYFGDGGPVVSTSFQLNGQPFYAMNGGPMFTFSPAVSLFVNCETQDEVDYYWEKLAEGGVHQRCGWLQDKFGLSWQVVPSVFGKLLGSKEPGVSQKVMQAMLQMDKLVIATLEAAAVQD